MNGRKKNQGLFITARVFSDLTGREQKFLFVLWNLAAFLLSSAALCAVSLSFAIGRFENLFYIFLGYIRTPEIFLLNWLPLLLVQLFFFALTNRQWSAFLITAAAALGMSIGNYFKLIFRSDPFTFSDLSSVRAGLSVAGEYDISIDWRILLAIVFAVTATLILFFFARCRMKRLSARAVLLLLAVLPIWPMWKHVYSDGNRYYENSYRNFLFVTRDTRDSFIANGFFYPFLYSITESDAVPPEGYSEEECEKQYRLYQNMDIPDSGKVNLMIIQLESFCDLEEMGIEGIAPEVYAPLRMLQNESFSGTMVASVIGGGTVVTERALLTGSYMQLNYEKTAFSYVRYFNAQGFRTFATHPNVGYFYARKAICDFLGFDRFYYLENYFQDITGGEWRCDDRYLPEVFRLFLEETEQGPAFSFNISLQGHSPYNSESFDKEDDLWSGRGVSDSSRYMLNNYLSQIRETQEVLLREIERLRSDPHPIVLMIYGDHKPWFGDEFYAEFGIPINMETEKGMVDYLGTPYLIWANDAAKKTLGNDFVGEGPMTSPGYLMNLLFGQLGWDGPAFMQFTEEVRKQISVICTKGGYLENECYTQNLDEEGNRLLKQYRDMLYYVHYRPELAG